MLFGQRLVARDHHAARIAAGVRLLHQLEERDDVLIVRDNALKLFEQVERDVGLPIRDRGAQIRKIIQQPERAHFVS
jgi:hypothetical protein